MEKQEGNGAPALLTMGESARVLAVSEMTIRRMLERGDLVRVRIGRSVRVSAKSVHDFAANLEGVTNAK